MSFQNAPGSNATTNPIYAAPITVATLPALPTGTNAIGTVAVTALPALTAGSAAIGTVAVTALPALPVGTNAIGTVSVTALPALPTGTNAIGTVSQTVGGTVVSTSNPIPVISRGATAVTTTITAATTSAQLLALNASRKTFILSNIGTSIANAFICYGTTATQAGAAFELTPGQVYEPASVVYTGAMSIIFDGTSGSLNVTEVTA